MGPLGWPETVFIFFLALLLFGPKKLPELGRTIGKAMTEFRRASTELKATFDREMKTLEQETDLKELKEAVSTYQYDTYNYDYSSYEGSNYESSNYESGNHEYGSEHTSEQIEASVSTPSITGASAPQGAESPTVVASHGEAAAVPESNGNAPEHTVARGGFGEHPEPNGHPASPETTEHKA
jgi:sec-independent protein translocase protein TatA